MVERWRAELTGLEQALAECAGRPLPVEPLGRLLLEGVLHVVPDEGGVRRPAVHVFGGGVYVPAYTSAGRMRAIMGGSAPRLALPGDTVLRAVRPPAELILNLGTWPARIVAHWELAGLLARWDRLPARHRVVAPRRYPGEVLEALWEHFRGSGAVAEAHVAQLDAEGERPRLVIGFRAHHPPMAQGLAARTRELAQAVYDADVHVHHLGVDELSRRIVDAGSRFFGEARPCGAVG